MARTLTPSLPYHDLDRAALAPAPQRSAINWRSVALGLAAVVLISALAPYNDFALNNTYIIGGNLPFGLVTLTFLFAVLVNGPLCRWWPRFSFSSGELAVAFSMALVGCAIPSAGLMRWWPGSLVSPFWQAESHGEYLSLLRDLSLPQWILPHFRGASLEDMIHDPVAVWFIQRTPPEEHTPYSAWLRPAFTWGIFLFAMYGALLCAVTIVRRQWTENERLPFPIAEIQLALITQPEPGSALNFFFRQRAFWFAFALVFFLRSWNSGARYWPQYFPPIPLEYDLGSLFTERPLSFIDYRVTHASIYFLVVGIGYFLSTPVAFSLWFFMILNQPYRIYVGSTGGDPGSLAYWDQHLGGVIAFALTAAWVGRSHWRLVISQAFRGVRPGEPRGRYLPYPLAFWGLVGCFAAMVGWLALAGCSIVGAVVVVGALLMLFMICTRIVAETGFTHGQLLVPLYKPWQWMQLAGIREPVSLQTFYYSCLLHSHHYDYREVVPVYASHGLKLADKTVFDSRELSSDGARDRAFGRRLIGLLALSLLVAYPISLGSTLWTEYRFSSSRDVSHETPMNKWGTVDSVETYILKPSTQYRSGTYRIAHNPFAHATAGFGLVALLAFLRLRYSWWPLHPVGFLMFGTWPGTTLWFSIMLGWMCKVLVVRFGGARGYLNAKPFFLGLIVGESVTAGLWLVLGLILNWMDIPLNSLSFTPN